MKNIFVVAIVIITIALIIPVSADDCCARYSHNQVCPATEVANAQATHYHAGDIVSSADNKTARYVEGYDPGTDVYGTGVVTVNPTGQIQISHRVSTENRVDFENDYPIYVSSFPTWFITPIPVEQWMNLGIQAGKDEY